MSFNIHRSDECLVRAWALASEGDGHPWPSWSLATNGKQKSSQGPRERERESGSEWESIRKACTVIELSGGIWKKWNWYPFTVEGSGKGNGKQTTHAPFFVLFLSLYWISLHSRTVATFLHTNRTSWFQLCEADVNEKEPRTEKVSDIICQFRQPKCAALGLPLNLFIWSVLICPAKYSREHSGGEKGKPQWESPAQLCFSPFPINSLCFPLRLLFFLDFQAD